MVEVSEVETVSVGLESQVLAAQAELKRRFGGIGCLARTSDFLRLFPGVDAAAVEEALHSLCDEGIAELECLGDGSFAFHFPRR